MDKHFMGMITTAKVEAGRGGAELEIHYKRQHGAT
jgi:hypothetical protein